MKAAAVSYVRALTRDDIFRRLAEGGPDAKILAGGQSLLAALAFRLSRPSVLIDIGRVADLKGIAVAGDVLRIGALTTHRDLGASALVAEFAPLLTKATQLIAHPAIRNRGTIGGSLAYADPASELPACVIALDATIVAAGPNGERRIPARDFFTGLFSTALTADEIIAHVEVARSNRRSAIVEIARRSGDYAMAGVALTASEAGGRLSAARPVFFGLGATAVLAENAGAVFEGAADARAAAAALRRDLDPPADQHGSSATKLHLAGVVLARAVAQLIAGHGNAR